MIIRQIALVSESAKVSHRELLNVSAALQRQVTRDFSPIWNVNATVDPFESSDQVPFGYWPIKVKDTIDEKGASGFHLDEHGQPYADVLWSDHWSLTASHECLEMLADPFGHHLTPGKSVKPDQGRVTYLVEVCDPCEASQFAYKIFTGMGGEETLVSDFYTPSYFDPVPSTGVRYSFQGSITAPRQVLNGGYLSWRNPEDGHIWQLFGPVELEQFKDGGTGTLNRENSDGIVHRTRTGNAKAVAKIVAKMVGRAGRAALRAAAAGGQCNLILDWSTGFLTGKTGDTTTVTIKDAAGSAQFESISYGDDVIGTAISSVTFPIASGKKDLDFEYVSDAGVRIQVGDPCDHAFSRFRSSGFGKSGFTVLGI